jgi:hypothetical protein
MTLYVVVCTVPLIILGVSSVIWIVHRRAEQGTNPHLVSDKNEDDETEETNVETKRYMVIDNTGQSSTSKP